MQLLQRNATINNVTERYICLTDQLLFLIMSFQYFCPGHVCPPSFGTTIPLKQKTKKEYKDIFS